MYVGADVGQVHGFHGQLEVPPPSADLHRFEARMRLDEHSDWLSVSLSQFLPQGASLRNTDWAYGVAVYTGPDTRLGRNRRQPPSKVTSSDRLINRFSAIVFALQLVIVLSLGLTGGLWEGLREPDHWYLGDPDEPWWRYMLPVLRFLVITSALIPISLKVTLDVVKFAYAQFINADRALADPITGQHSFAASTALAEQLGQIDCVFADKTGTLTENRMLLQSCCVGERLFSMQDADPSLDEALLRHDAPVVDFFRCLALCHGVVPAPAPESVAALVYRSSSPDEKALVEAAAARRVVFLRREPQQLEISCMGQPERYEILHTLEFTSERRRMSVLLRALDGGHVLLLCKGADDALFPRLAPGQEAKRDAVRRHVETFARAGLRTMLVAQRHVAPDELRVWNEAFREASTRLEGREAALAEASLSSLSLSLSTRVLCIAQLFVR